MRDRSAQSLKSVLMVTNGVPPDQLGGLQRYVRELAGALSGRGLQVAIVARANDPRMAGARTGTDGVTVTRYEVPPRSGLLYAGQYPLYTLSGVSRSLRAHADAIVHSHFPLQGIVPTFSGRPLVHTFHAPMHKEVTEERSYPWPKRLDAFGVMGAMAVQRRVASRASHTVVLSEFMRGELAHLSATAATNATLLPGGLDLDQFKPGRQLHSTWIKEASPLLFTARRLVPRNGVSELIDALRVVRAGPLPRARLAVAGAGPLDEQLREKAQALGLAADVSFLGRVSDDDLVRWYRTADLFVLPTQRLEGFGLATAEALACGTPAVGTPAGATPEILAGLDPRLVANDATPQALALAIADVCCDEQAMASISARARSHVAPRFGWPAIADKHIEIYRKLGLASEP